MANDQEKTISDFSNQWEFFPDNEGYYISNELFADSLGGMIAPSDFKNKVSLDLGSGTGRIVRWLIAADSSHVYAVEPASTFETLKLNTKQFSDRITYINSGVEKQGLDRQVDIAISLGVISYIPKPEIAFEAIFKSLVPGGKFYVLVMAYEGNELYYWLVTPLRKFAGILPDAVLLQLTRLLSVPATIYGNLAKWFRLPMHDYFSSVYLKMGWHARVMLIFDQLNPTYAKYFRAHELEAVFKNAGFANIKKVHRYGYSWAMIGEKPLGS